MRHQLSGLFAGPLLALGLALAAPFSVPGAAASEATVTKEAAVAGAAGATKAANEPKEAAPLAADPVAEKRLQKLSEELRCLVCQNQNIADSNAELAQDLRREIRGMIRTGKSDKEIIDFMVARYGDFVLYRPPFKAATVFLWVGPLLLMALGLVALVRYMKRRNRRLAEAGDAALSPEDARRADALLNERNP